MDQRLGQTKDFIVMTSAPPKDIKSIPVVILIMGIQNNKRKTFQTYENMKTYQDVVLMPLF